jgi:creatinine amidohydrolase/Fe(II)-dependent formamide hydrolase-like protein/GNAT superfamily N-acetyltransferase
MGAALLPALPFGTCMEHTGFRGSVSLRPETLMQVIRDVADEMERQHFRVLILLNGHGGNFALGPVVRDINRRDRAIKLLLVDWWEHAASDIARDGRDRGPDIHAGEMETSVLQAIHPDLVRPEPKDRAATPSEVFPLVQRDLNTFGVGHFNPNGVIGYPSLATAEKGQTLIQSVRAGLAPYVRDRVRRLAEQSRYAGPGGIAVRPMTARDVGDGMRLARLAGWNQTEDDWRRFFEAPSCTCHAAVHDGRVVGTVTALRYGDDLGWVGMMLVDPAFRRRGIGGLLLRHAVDDLSACRAVKLDATPAGEPLYATLGFVGESRLHRLTHAGLPGLPDGPAVRDIQPVTEENWAGIAALDRSVSGADRGWLLRALADDDPARAFCLVRSGRTEGFCLGRRGTNYHQIGPIVASRAEDAIHLAQAAMHSLAGRPIVLDVPDTQPAFLGWLSDLGFIRQRPFLRMVRAQTPEPIPQDSLFAICGPELG